MKYYRAATKSWLSRSLLGRCPAVEMCIQWNERHSIGANGKSLEVLDCCCFVEAKQRLRTALALLCRLKVVLLCSLLVIQ